MRKYLIAFVGLTLMSSVALAVHDWHDLDAVHNQVIESIHELERARAANGYDMEGHGARAEQLLHQAEHELKLAIEASRRH